MLVSGGTQGVGAGIARAAAREGATVVVTGRRADVGEAVAALAGGRRDGEYVQADVADVARHRRRWPPSVERHGRIDCLVNAAGLTTRGTLLDTTPELFDQHIAVNLRGPFFLMQAAVARHGRAAARRARSSTSSRSSEHGGQPLPRAVRRREGRPRRADPQRRARAPLGPDPDQRPEHRLDRHRGRGRHPARIPRRRRRLARAGRPRPCRWASSARSTRSPTSSCSCCPTAAAWSPARSSTGTRTSSAAR